MQVTEIFDMSEAVPQSQHSAMPRPSSSCGPVVSRDDMPFGQYTLILNIKLRIVQRT